MHVHYAQLMMLEGCVDAGVSTDVDAHPRSFINPLHL